MNRMLGGRSSPSAGETSVRSMTASANRATTDVLQSRKFCLLCHLVAARYHPYANAARMWLSDRWDESYMKTAVWIILLSMLAAASWAAAPDAHDAQADAAAGAAVNRRRADIQAQRPSGDPSSADFL